jgi:hypothetical protein
MKLRASKFVVVMLVAVLVTAPLAASIWHHHTGSSDANCPVCHFNHQPMDRPAESPRFCSILAVTYSSRPAEARYIANRDIRPLPSRAPPAV